jgi:hypothetical protein
MLTAEMLKPALALRGEPASSFEPLGGKLEVYSTSSSPALQLRCEFLGTHGVIGAWRPFSAARSGRPCQNHEPCNSPPQWYERTESRA